MPRSNYTNCKKMEENVCLGVCLDQRFFVPTLWKALQNICGACTDLAGTDGNTVGWRQAVTNNYTF